jgi:hypothetical protein
MVRTRNAGFGWLSNLARPYPVVVAARTPLRRSGSMSNLNAADTTIDERAI